MKVFQILMSIAFIALVNKGNSQELTVITNNLLDYTKIQEIPLEQMRYDKKSGIMYVFARDAKKFYAYVRISDEMLQRQVMIQGLNFWIDSTGRKKQLFGMKFPNVKQKQRNKPMQMQGDLPSEERPERPDFESFNELVVYGLSEPKVPDYLFMPNNIGFCASAIINEYGVLYLKYTLPLHYLGSGARLNLGFELAESDKESGFGNQMPINAQMNAGGMQMSTGGGGGQRGGRPGGNSGGGRMDQQGPGGGAQSGSVKVWVKKIVLF
jgi:hypothetical protein